VKLNIQYLTNESGIKQAVQIPLKQWLLFQNEVRELNKYLGFYKGIEEAMHEVLLIEKGKKKAQSLSEFLDEC
jgi:hypothetical protein